MGRSVFGGSAANPVSQSVSFTTGVESSDSETQEFAVTIGLEVSADFEVMSTKLSTSFTASTSTTHTITLSSSQTVTNTFTVNPNTTGQVWQLVQIFSAAGVSITQPLNFFLSLSYPATNVISL
jgi:hypothetical protein